MNLNGENIISFVNTANLLQVEETRYIDHIKPFINKKNIFVFLHLSTISSQRSLRTYLSSIIKHSFVSLSKTAEFNAIDYNCFKLIIQSSDLRVSSELEVFEAVVSWVQYDEKTRKKFMCNLLKVIRLPLLSPEVLEHVIKKNPFCYNCPKCCDYIGSVQNGKSNNTSLTSLQSQNRCCKSEYVAFMFINDDEKYFCKCEGEEYLCKKLKDDFKFEKISKTVRDQNFYKTAYCLVNYVDGLYVLNSCNEYPIRFSYDSKQCKNIVWELDHDPEEFWDYASCLFMGKLYILGGMVYDRRLDYAIDECHVYDPDKDKISGINKMLKSRGDHSCVVYGGKIVVTGGVDGTINSVESYDHFEDKWTLMPDLTEEQFGHSSVAMGNKLYVVGTRNCEVFDDVSNKFSLIKPPPVVFNDFIKQPPVVFNGTFETFRVEKEIIVKLSVQKDDKRDNIYIYNTNTDDWTAMCVEMFKETKYISYSSIIYKC